MNLGWKTSPFQQGLIQCLQGEMPTSSDVTVISSLQNALREITIKAPAGADLNTGAHHVDQESSLTYMRTNVQQMFNRTFISN